MNKILDNLINKILIIKQEDYRVNDIVSKSGERWEYSGKNILKKNKYDGTILKTYLIENGLYNPLNLETLLLITENYNNSNNFSNPTINELVMHLRLGDYEKLKDNFLKKDYVKEIKIFLDKYPNIDKLTIITAFSYGTWSKDSLHLRKESPLWLITKKSQDRNIKCIRLLLKKLIIEFPKLSIDIKSSKNIDEDFCYCIMSKYYIHDVGGFSKLIYNLNNIRLNCRQALNFIV
jgi:hypothetical protein